MQVRVARETDLDRIAAIHVASWRAVYRGQLPARFLESLDVSRRREMWRSCLKGRDELHVIEIEEEGVIGFLCIGPARDDDMANATELKAIHLTPERYGKGMGTLFWKAVEQLIETSTVYLWVLSTNSLGKAFYRKNGFAPDQKSKPLEMDEQCFIELRYRKVLRPK